MGRRTETAYKARSPGNLAKHNNALDFRKYGKCRGCVTTVYVLIRGDLPDMRLSAMGATVPYGNMQDDRTGVSRSLW